MTKAGAWSYSRMKGFETCPKQYYHVNVLKEYPFEETVATRYGNEFHKAAELYIKDNQPVPGKFAEFEPILQSLRDKPGDKHCELKLGLTADLEPCGFFAKNVWFRGVVDLLIIDGDRAFIVDYKTGKSAKYADPDQLELMALTVFAHYPQSKRLRPGLCLSSPMPSSKKTTTRVAGRNAGPGGLRAMRRWRRRTRQKCSTPVRQVCAGPTVLW
jgi:hypothetical protein